MAEHKNQGDANKPRDPTAHEQVSQQPRQLQPIITAFEAAHRALAKADISRLITRSLRCGFDVEYAPRRQKSVQSQ